MGGGILAGLLETFVHLLTVNYFQTGNPEHVEHKAHLDKLNKARRTLKDHKQAHIAAHAKDSAYNPDAENYFKFLPKFETILEPGKVYSQVENPCFKVGILIIHTPKLQKYFAHDINNHFVF